MEETKLVRELLYLSMDILGKTHKITINLSDELEKLVIIEQMKEAERITKKESCKSNPI